MGTNSQEQNISLAWLDDSTNEEKAMNQEQLRLIDNNLKILKNKTECDEYLNSLPDQARITFIVNGRLGQQVVPEIQNSPKIVGIHVFCLNKDMHFQWASKITKVKGVYVDLNELKKALQPNPPPPSPHKSIISPVSTTDTTPAPAITIECTYEVDGSYLISDNCLDFIVKMKMLPTEINELVSFCQEALKENRTVLSLIQEFQKTYSADQAISWLNKDPFFYTYIDNCFKTGWVSAFFPWRVFIRDIYRQLEQHKPKSTMEVYYCDLITNENFQKLKSFNGKIIAIKSFILANSNRQAMEAYIADYGQSNDNKRILYIIEANPDIKGIKPFAKIGTLSDYNDPNDVMFMVGSLFKITEIQDETNGIINIKMSLCTYDDNENTTKALFDELKAQYIDSNEQTDAIKFGQFLARIGKSMNSKNLCDTGESIIRSCLQKLSNDDPERACCQDALGEINFYNGELDASLDFYEKALEIKKQKGHANTPEIAESYKNLAMVYLQKEDYPKALEYSTSLLALWKQLHGDDYQLLSICYINIASIHEKTDKIQDAISCYYKALAILIQYASENDPNVAALYHNLGNMHRCYQQNHLALGYYITALEMKLKSPTPVKTSVALTYYNIGLVYHDMQNVEQSRENLEKALTIYREIYPLENPIIKEIEELIKTPPN